MKRLIFIAVVAAASVVGLSSVTAHAKTAQPSNIHDQPYHSRYVAGQDIKITEPVNGDLYCAGEKVTVDTTVTGDVLCAGADLTIKGMVEGDVRAAGATMTLAGTVNGNVTLAGSEIKTTPEFKLGHDATIFASTADLQGSFGNDVVISGSVITFKHASVARDVTSAAGQVKLKDQTNVGGWMRHTGEQHPEVESGSKVGNVITTQPERPTLMETMRSWAFMILALTLFVVLTIVLAPRVVRVIAQDATNRIVAVFIGAGWCLFAPILGVLLLISALTWPLGLVVLLVWALSLLLALPTTAIDLGRLITRKAQASDLVRALIGMAAITVMSVIPVLNVLLIVSIGLYGTGRVVTASYRQMTGARPMKKT